MVNLEMGGEGEEKEEHRGCCDTFHFEKEVLMGLRLCVLNRNGYIVRSVFCSSRTVLYHRMQIFSLFELVVESFYGPGCSLHFKRISMPTSLSVRLSYTKCANAKGISLSNLSISLASTRQIYKNQTNSPSSLPHSTPITICPFLLFC